MNTEQEDSESDSSNTSELRRSVEEIASMPNEQVRHDAKDEIIVDLPSPVEYESETNNNNNNDCTFYKQNLAKQALAGVF